MKTTNQRQMEKEKGKGKTIRRKSKNIFRIKFKIQKYINLRIICLCTI